MEQLVATSLGDLSGRVDEHADMLQDQTTMRTATERGVSSTSVAPLPNMPTSHRSGAKNPISLSALRPSSDIADVVLPSALVVTDLTTLVIDPPVFACP